MKILSSFTHPHVITNLYDCLTSVEHEIYFEELFLSYFLCMNKHDQNYSTLVCKINTLVSFVSDIVFIW